MDKIKRRPAKPLAFILPAAFLLLFFLVGVAFLLPLPLHLVDFEHYLAASRMIWNSASPYGEVEFFAPPWMAVLIGPFLLLPVPAASTLWMLLNFGSIFLAALFSLQWTEAGLKFPWRVLLPAALCLMPASLYCYITGQVSPLVGCAIVVFAWSLNRRPGSLWLFPVLALVAAFKPHLAFFPLGLCLLEILRKRRWGILLALLAGAFAAAVFAFATNPNWISDMILSWQEGNFLGGKPGLAAAGFRGIRDFGIPFWVFLPYVLYLLVRWARDGLTGPVLALAMTIGFLVFAYSRRYDYVCFVLPGCVLLADSSRRKRLPAALAILSLFVIPFFNYSLLAALIMTIGVMLGFPPPGAGFPPSGKAAPERKATRPGDS